MSERPENPGNNNKPHPLSDEPGFVDGIPVEELVRMTREFTSRIINEDRQRLAMELNETGHQRSLQLTAPFLLQQFFTGKIDLDLELARRYPGAPLLSNHSFTPAPGTHAKHGFAQFQTQDNSAVMTVEIHGTNGALDLSFLLGGMIGVRFALGAVPGTYRRRFFELMHRENGIAFLWTRERWERDYLIFIMRDSFPRLYAFGAGRYDAVARLTPEGLDKWMIWLRGFWSDDMENDTEPEPEDNPSGALSW
jgi:hypothetical protein